MLTTINSSHWKFKSENYMTHTDIMFQLVFLRKKIELVLEWLFNQKACKKNRIKKISLAQHGNNKFSYCWTSVVTNIWQTLGHLHVSISGWVVVYSEPSTHQEIVPVNRPWEVAVGVHPKNTDEFSSDRFLLIAELLNLPHMVALGEVRLDRTALVKLWRQQETV